MGGALRNGKSADISLPIEGYKSRIQVELPLLELYKVGRS